MVLLQAALGLGILFYLIGLFLAFILLPTLFIVFNLLLVQRQKKKTLILSVKHRVIIALKALLFAVIIIFLICLVIFLLAEMFFDPINN